MKTKQTRPTGIQFPRVYQAPVNAEMDEYIKRAAWDMGKKMGMKISLAEWGRRQMLPYAWPKQLAEWRKEQTDFDPNEFSGRKRIEGVDGHKAKKNSGSNSAIQKRHI